MGETEAGESAPWKSCFCRMGIIIMTGASEVPVSQGDWKIKLGDQIRWWGIPGAKDWHFTDSTEDGLVFHYFWQLGTTEYYMVTCTEYCSWRSLGYNLGSFEKDASL